MRIKKIMLSLITLFFSAVVFAADFSCPDITSATGDNRESESFFAIAPGKLYLYTQINKLNTGKRWRIVIGPLKSTTMERLGLLAQKLIMNASPPSTIRYDEYEQPYCSYKTDDENVYITVYEFDPMTSSFQTRKSIS